MVKSCFVKCLGCKWECESLYANQTGTSISDEDKCARNAIENVMRDMYNKAHQEASLQRSKT